MSNNIFQIQKEYLDVINSILENDGEVSDSDYELLNSITTQLEHKGKSYYYIIKQLKGDVDMIANEMERLRKMKQARENLIERLRTMLLNAMQLIGVEKIKSDMVSISIRATTSVNVVDEEKVPSKYVTWHRKIDKRMISDDIKNGVDVDGVQLEENKSLIMR